MVATLVPGDNALLVLERKVAVKKLQLSDNMDEERFLRVSPLHLPVPKMT